MPVQKVVLGKHHAELSVLPTSPRVHLTTYGQGNAVPEPTRQHANFVGHVLQALHPCDAWEQELRFHERQHTPVHLVAKTQPTVAPFSAAPYLPLSCEHECVLEAARHHNNSAHKRAKCSIDSLYRCLWTPCRVHVASPKLP